LKATDRIGGRVNTVVLSNGCDEQDVEENVGSVVHVHVNAWSLEQIGGIIHFMISHCG
jgi:hypothetical protein